MNVDLIRALAKQKGLSLTKLEEILGFGNGTIGKWAKQSPSCDKLSAVADYLSVSIDYLYYGKEKSPTSVLSEDEHELLMIFNLVSEREKGELLGYARRMVETSSPESREGVS